MTDSADEYTDDDVDELFRWLADAMNDWEGDVGKIRITADIQWAGEYNRKRHRTTTLSPMRLGKVRDAVNAGVDEQGRAARAQREPGWLRGGWHSQIRELTRTKAGYAAADRAGLTVTVDTLKGWLAGNEPNKANRAKIEKAAISLQYERAAAARARSLAARRAAIDALTEVVEATYDGAEIRFFNPSDLEIE